MLSAMYDAVRNGEDAAAAVMAVEPAHEAVERGAVLTSAAERQIGVRQSSSAGVARGEVRRRAEPVDLSGQRWRLWDDGTVPEQRELDQGRSCV
jgi:hypothetical protein